MLYPKYLMILSTLLHFTFCSLVQLICIIFYNWTTLTIIVDFFFPTIPIYCSKDQFQMKKNTNHTENPTRLYLNSKTQIPTTRSGQGFWFTFYRQSTQANPQSISSKQCNNSSFFFNKTQIKVKQFNCSFANRNFANFSLPLSCSTVRHLLLIFSSVIIILLDILLATFLD